MSFAQSDKEMKHSTARPYIGYKLSCMDCRLVWKGWYSVVKSGTSTIKRYIQQIIHHSKDAFSLAALSVFTVLFWGAVLYLMYRNVNSIWMRRAKQWFSDLMLVYRRSKPKSQFYSTKMCHSKPPNFWISFLFAVCKRMKNWPCAGRRQWTSGSVANDSVQRCFWKSWNWWWQIPHHCN